MNYYNIIGYFQKTRLLKYQALLVMSTIVLGLLVACGDNTVTAVPPTSAPATTAPATTVPATTVAPTTVPVTIAPAATSPAAAITTAPAATAATSPGAVPDEIIKPFDAASKDLAKRNNITLQNIQMLGYNYEDFPDSSLGCPQPNVRYLQVITPGYQIQLEANGQQYDYRTNVSGTRVVLCTNARGFPGPIKTTP